MFKCVRKLTVHPSFFFCLAWIVFTESSFVLLGIIVSVFLHECGHIFVYSRAHVVIDEIHLQPFGVRITVRNEALIRPCTQLICALAGPFVNLICVLIIRLISEITHLPDWVWVFCLSNLFLGIFNLLPIMPLDGSRILAVLLAAVFHEYVSQIVCAWISLIVGVCVFIFGIYVLIDTGVNLSLCMLAGYILICLAVKIYNMLKKRKSHVKPKT